MMKCRHETPCSRRCIYIEEIEPCCGYSNCKYFQPNYTTNADRIRAMSDEELADFMAERYSNERTANILGSLIGEGYVVTEAMRRALHEKMRMQWLYWLRQPVKDGDCDD